MPDDRCPRCDQAACPAAREVWERLAAKADAYSPRAIAAPMAVSGCSLTTLCCGPPVDWRARALKAEADTARLREALAALILCRRAVAAAPVSECDETCPPDCHAALMREAVTALASLKALEEMGDYAPAGLDVHPTPTPAQREAADPEADRGGAEPQEAQE